MMRIVSEPIRRSQLVVQHFWNCSACDNTETQAIAVALGGEAPKPHPPNGWAILHTRLFCPRHVVQLQLVVKDAA
jgi:hypothetical protein